MSFIYDKPEEPEGMWVIPCPRCDGRQFLRDHCGMCEHSELGVKGWVLIDAIDTMPACKIEDHHWEIEFDAGSYRMRCIDAHTRQEQEAMLRHTDFRYVPGCMENSELHDMLAGTISCKVRLVVTGGSYEYPDDVDVWYEIDTIDGFTGE